MPKDNFLLFLDQWPALSTMTDAERGQLLQAIFAHHGACEMPELTGIPLAIFLLMKPRLENLATAYDKKCEQNKVNGKLGGRPRKTEKPNGFDDKPTSETQKPNGFFQNPLDNDSDNEFDVNNNTPLTPQGGSDGAPCILPVIPKPKRERAKFIKPTPDEVNAYCQERGNGISGQAFCDFYESKGWIAGKTPMKDWQAAVRTWENRRKDSPPGQGSMLQTQGGYPRATTQAQKQHQDRAMMASMLLEERNAERRRAAQNTGEPVNALPAGWSFPAGTGNTR